MTDQLETSDALSGFDMASTIEWYAQDECALHKQITEGGDAAIATPDLESLEHVSLHSGLVAALLSRFPQAARDRSITRKIVGAPSMWFHRDSTAEEPKPTTDVDEALSPTAIIPSYISYEPWQRTGSPAADIYLYSIPDGEGLSDMVKTIILAEGLIHEYAHSIAVEMSYNTSYKLKLGDEVKEGLEVLIEFAGLTESIPAMSHYSSTYRVDGGEYPEDPTAWTIAVNEELAEAIAAYLLGFVFCEDEERRKDPFKDRPEVAEFVEKFLNASRIDLQP